jgi:hypothetical protein
MKHWPQAGYRTARANMSLAATGARAGEGLRRAQSDLFLEAERARPTFEHQERAPR